MRSTPCCPATVAPARQPGSDRALSWWSWPSVCAGPPVQKYALRALAGGMSVCVACSAVAVHKRRLVAEIAHARGRPIGHRLDGGQPNPVKDSLIGGQFGHSDLPRRSQEEVACFF